MNGVQNLNLQLTLTEVNLVLEALGQMPYARVHQLIAKLHQQAESQLQESRSETREMDPTSD